MADPIVISRVPALPQTLVANTMYIVKPVGSNKAVITVVGDTASAVGSTVSQDDLTNEIQVALREVSRIYFVENIAQMQAIMPIGNSMAYVSDASGDPQFEGSGPGAYVYNRSLGIWVAIPGTYKPVVQWAEIAGRPASTPAEIDAAVNERHTHSNMNVLNQLQVNQNNELTYGGEVVANVRFGASNW